MIIQFLKLAFLNKLKKRVNEIGIEISFTESLIEAIAETKGTEKYGARPIKRRVTELLENELASMIINKEVSKGDMIKVDYINNEVKFFVGIAVCGFNFSS